MTHHAGEPGHQFRRTVNEQTVDQYDVAKLPQTVTEATTARTECPLIEFVKAVLAFEYVVNKLEAFTCLFGYRWMLDVDKPGGKDIQRS